MLETRTAKHVCREAERIKRERVDAETERSVMLQLIEVLLRHAMHAEDCGPRYQDPNCRCHISKARQVLKREKR